MKKLLMLLLMITMVLSACSNEVSVPLPAEESMPEASIKEPDSTLEEAVKTEEVVKIEEVKTEEATVEQTNEIEEVAEVIDQELVDGLKSLVLEGDLVEVWSYILQETAAANSVTSEQLIIEYMVIAEDQVWSVGDPLFEAGWELHEAIYQIFDDHEGEFKQTHIIIGEDKALLLSYMPETYKEVLGGLFDMGYGLVNAEGSYYPVVDYEMLIRVSQGSFSDMTMTYLDIQQDALIKQTTVEEYLNLTAFELMNRCVSVEKFLMTYEERPELYTVMMTHQLNTCLYKLSTPSPFDGGLNEDGRLANDFQSIYDTILKTKPTPVVTEVVRQVMNWIDSRENGYVATYNDSEELYKVSGEIYGKATEMVTTLYK